MDKKPFQSKKFICFIIAIVIIAGILITALLSQPFTWPMAAFMAIGITGVCALSIGYIISQKALDKFLIGLKNLPTNIRDDG